jgi:hypothetical protein
MTIEELIQQEKNKKIDEYRKQFFEFNFMMIHEDEDGTVTIVEEPTDADFEEAMEIEELLKEANMEDDD